MLRSLRVILCASTAAFALSAAAPVAGFVAPAQAQVDVVISASVPPPVLPVYAQPPIPGPGYIWIPGYWAWDGSEYYWVPGYWATPPAVDLYWTPGYWAWDDSDNDYVFYAGYWGPTVGFYGGIDYGYGYTGEGYHGGYWRNRQFFYNQAVNNLGGVRIANVYDQPIPAVQPAGVAFNGGRGGTAVRPTQQQLALARERHMGPTPTQMQHVEAARQMTALRFNQNHGAPPVAATDRPGAFRGPHVVAASRTEAGAPGAHPGAADAGAAAGAAAGAIAAHGAMNRPGPQAGRPEHMTRTGPNSAGAPGIAGERNFTRHNAGPQNFARQTPQMRRNMATPGAPRAPGVRENLAAHGAVSRGPTTHPNFAARGPATHASPMRQNFAAHGPAMRPNFAARGPQMRAPSPPRNFAHGPQMRAGGPNFGGMRMGGAPNPGGMRFGGGGPGGPPHIGGGAPHFAGGGPGGPPHIGGAPHGGGPRPGGGGPGGPERRMP